MGAKGHGVSSSTEIKAIVANRHDR
jgi:hypothetical protein